jgi:hypothetical protein
MNPFTRARAVRELIDTAQQLSARGQANGYCPLGADAKVPSAYLPAGGGADYIVGEVRWFATSANIPAGWYLCDGEAHNGITTPNLIGKYLKSASTAGGTGGSATHQHAAASAGTPAGTVGTIPATEGLGIGATASPGASYAAQEHTHPAPSFTGSALATHQHDAANGEPPYYELMPYEYCGVA